MKSNVSPFVVLLLALCGCQTIKAPSWNMFGSKVKESSYAAPARIAIMWSPAILNQAGKVPTRGFGGRVYFYDAKNNPIAVEGQLVVYAYNNDAPKPDSKVPDRKYAFTPEQFATHYAPSELGASYSIWIPWDDVGKPQAEISLVPVFTSTSGALVMGEPSRTLLPGPKTPAPTSYITNCTVLPGEALPGEALPGEVLPQQLPGAASAQYGVQQASFSGQLPLQTPLAPPAGFGAAQVHQQGGLSTMSIMMPGTMADRLATAPPQISLLQRMAQLRQESLARQQPYVGWDKAAPAAGPPNATAAGPPQTPPAAQQTPATAPAGVPQPWFPAAPPPVRSSLPAQPVPVAPILPQAAGPLPLPRSP